MTDGNEKYDYVITERICRSPKFLSAVVSGKPIVSVEWLEALDQQKTWLDPLNYLLKDNKGEKEFGFNLSATLLKATNERLFENYSILVTAHTTIAPALLRGKHLIDRKHLSRYFINPQWMFVSCRRDL